MRSMRQPLLRVQCSWMLLRSKNSCFKLLQCVREAFLCGLKAQGGIYTGTHQSNTEPIPRSNMLSQYCR